ncbi:MAG TPA: ABC transporter ATP-binding protein [Clostridiales bacterium]|nr:ABC transporter ATP-binding protein [Clostridiales bacterium]
MISLNKVTSGYMGVNIIKDISLSFEKGNIISIIGKNGCGKTTLLKTASRLIKPYSGDVLLNENSIFNITSKEVARHISYLPQNRDVPSIKAYDLVMHGRFPYLKFPRIPTDDDKRLAEEAIERLKITEYKDKNIRELSGGERQKVYLAMILAQDTDIIFLDEPTTFLDINHQLEILKIVKDLKKMGKTIVMVIHDLNSALTYSDKVCLMDKGQIVIYDTPQNVYKSKLIENTFEIQCQELSVSNKGERQYVFSI